MSTTIACSRSDLIKKLLDLNFHGPVKISGREFMMYHGQALVVPQKRTLSVPQFRMMLREVDELISKEEWQN